VGQSSIIIVAVKSQQCTTLRNNVLEHRSARFELLTFNQRQERAGTSQSIECFRNVARDRNLVPGTDQRLCDALDQRSVRPNNKNRCHVSSLFLAAIASGERDNAHR
jgi:RNA:NAD 2'-phosphotransferase (TPT1/KptA family)